MMRRLLQSMENARSRRQEPVEFRTPAEHALHEEGLFKQAIETGRTRVLITGAVMALAFAVVGIRLIDVTAFNNPSEPRVTHAVSASTVKKERADIVDRNGTLVATALKTVGLSADPKKIMDIQEAASKLAAVLPDLSAADIARKLSSDSRFVWLHRKLTPYQQWEVNRLGIPGLDFRTQETRVYPQGNLMSHVLGFTSIDNNGLAGIEKKLDQTLRSSTQPLKLSVDVRLQHIMRQELQAAVTEFDAIGATGIIMDVNNGEILSMVSLPDFDPNDAGKATDDSRFNRATLGVYELGSTFKIFNTAVALDTGTAKLSSQFDATKPLRVGRFAIRDYHAKNRWLSVSEIFIYSSNIGSARIANELGTASQREFLAKLGFLTPSSIELPEVGQPLYPKVWRPVNTMTISYGHGLAVSPIQLVSGVSAMVNGGTFYQPTLVRSDTDRNGERIISESTSNAIRKLMRLNNIEGSGKASNAKGYLVGGKTGTAEKVGARGTYRKKDLISSYVAAFPMNAPRYVVYVNLDEPRGTKKTFGYATGGWVAAPAVSQVIKQMAPMLGIPPQDPESPEIRQALAIKLPNQGKTLASF
ncbi:peptidoglycan D,D-transpeptidase FtsI family protein [Aestuariispira insulae]|uniref:Cell division protein FtsI (Penicillin-binding protein 3) n=1 Tax=Aestuariispira insulae TaxID=1461337 RepID=A0A3D9HX78_9PROT|nr:penicillin-binding protein 2 [Aestuariispira insulae]RED54108.1 cell division protein FtsI (penicillin-binding protein 3) [Aestuariispira insulae]